MCMINTAIGTLCVHTPGEKDISVPLAYYLTHEMDGLKCIFLKNVNLAYLLF